MKRIMTICIALTAITLMATFVQAEVTIVFDPDIIIQSYPADSSGLKASQENARRVHADWASSYYGTFSDVLQSGHTQPQDYNTYMNWRDSLGAGEGIAMLNTWFLNNGAAQSWGETVVVKPGTTVTGTAADGWNVRIIDDPYGLGGSCVQWWTLDSTKLINTVSDIGKFSFTADLYWDDNANGWDESDRAVMTGDEVRFWIGGLNGDDSEFYRDDTQCLYFDDQGWGTRDGYGAFSSLYSTGSGDYGSGFEAAISATVVPAPGALLLSGIGCGLVGWLRKRRTL